MSSATKHNKRQNWKIDRLLAKVDPLMANASCQEIYELGERRSGKYFIQPDKNLSPFEVFCSIFDNEAETHIRHEFWNSKKYTSTPDSDDGCSNAGCYNDVIKYSATVEQIQALIRISVKCEQKINHECNINALSGFGWWTGPNGNINQYWDGDGTQITQGCSCSRTSSCNNQHSDNVNICNCDDRGINDIDNGLLTMKENLPGQTTS